MTTTDPQERDILLALLSVPECRERAGLPPRGPLTLRQIAGYVGCSPTTVMRIEQRAMRKLKRIINRPINMHDLITLPPTTPATTTDTVSSQVADANAIHEAMVAHASAAKAESKLAVSCAIRLGKVLTEIKANSKHGGWERLFSNADQRLTSTKSGNVNRDLHFNFSHQTAHKYMRLYAKITEQLPDDDRPLLAAACETQRADTPLPQALLGKAGECESLTQCYVDFGIVSRPISARKDKSKTILDNRNDAGGPTKAELAARPVSPVEVRRQRALEEAVRIARALGSFERDEMAMLLPPPDLQLLIAALREYADRFAAIR